MAQLDLVIRGGTVVDGTGVPRYQADVGIKNGRVARVSPTLTPASMSAFSSMLAAGRLHSLHKRQIGRAHV